MSHSSWTLSKGKQTAEIHQAFATQGTAREKVSKKQDWRATGSGFPSSGQSPPGQGPVTAENVPVLSAL